MTLVNNFGMCPGGRWFRRLSAEKRRERLARLDAWLLRLRAARPLFFHLLVLAVVLIVLVLVLLLKTLSLGGSHK